MDRPYPQVAMLFAYGGDASRARALLAEQERLVEPVLLRAREWRRSRALAMVALTEGRPRDAIAEIQRGRADRPGEKLFGLPLLARAYEKYLQEPLFERIFEDSGYLAPSLLRAAELNAARGHRARAIAYYDRFIQLWKDADPDLQPRVADARRKMEVLAAQERS